jgi:hypothetical protein
MSMEKEYLITILSSPDAYGARDVLINVVYRVSDPKRAINLGRAIAKRYNNAPFSVYTRESMELVFKS